MMPSLRLYGFHLNWFFFHLPSLVSFSPKLHWHPAVLFIIYLRRWRNDQVQPKLCFCLGFLCSMMDLGLYTCYMLSVVADLKPRHYYYCPFVELRLRSRRLCVDNIHPGFYGSGHVWGPVIHHIPSPCFQYLLYRWVHTGLYVMAPDYGCLWRTARIGL